MSRRSVIDVAAFADVWEHVRLLSDAPRNEAMLAMLERRAPGNRVLEVGCGTGLLSCIAARLGAREVHAVEPTSQVEVARELVAWNGLEGVVQVHEGMVEDLEPRPVDLAFSELLNADPFAEGVLEAMDAAAAWLDEGGRLAPRRLQLFMALIRDETSASEVERVRDVVRVLETRHGLDLGPLSGALDTLDPYGFVAPRVDVVSPPVCIADLTLGVGEEPVEEQRVRLLPEASGPVGGVAVWFRAELDDGLVLHNAPGHPGHWGHLVLGWPVHLEGRSDQPVEVDVRIDVDEGVVAMPAR